MTDGTSPTSAIGRLIAFCIDNKLVVALATMVVVAWGALVAPFEWDLAGLPRDPVPVDAIPDTGENQQIVFTEWPGRSPQDVEDQITYPLSVAMLGVPGVKSIRTSSMFGFSSIFAIFEEDVDFYWSRSRVLETLASLRPGTLPDGVQPVLGPSATGLGQVFWYTLEGRDSEGRPVGGWDPQQLRTIQDFYVRYALASVPGVAEVASIGGFVQEYQVDVDPDALRAFGLGLQEVLTALRKSNVEVGARTIEVNRVEYVIRGLGFIEQIEDLEQTVIKVTDNVPVTIAQVAQVARGPALRRGALDKGGAEAVGGVVVVRYGENPLDVIQRVKQRIEEMAPGLPTTTLADGTASRVTVVSFYDRTQLIQETLDTLRTALTDEILVTIIVVLVMVSHLRSSLMISGLLPLAVLMCFVAMKQFGVDANIVALSGIAIAIGTMVDMGIVLTENILRRLEEARDGEPTAATVLRASAEVGGAVLTAVLTTVVSFLPVFTMEGPEGKLFKPLAYTKTFALLASIVVTLVVLPPLAHALLGRRARGLRRRLLLWLPLAAAVLAASRGVWWSAVALVGIAAAQVVGPLVSEGLRRGVGRVVNLAVAVALAVVLAEHWRPLGIDRDWDNVLFAGGVIGVVLGVFYLFLKSYEPVLRWCLAHKALFLCMPAGLVLFGGTVWFGFDRVIADPLARLGLGTSEHAWRWERGAFPGLGKEFMPPLDEGSYLLMPTTNPHASIGEALDVLRKQDRAIANLPEVDNVVGKIGRVESALDPAPISMVETVVTYKPEFVPGTDGRPGRFAYDPEAGEFVRDDFGHLVPDSEGRPYRQWRPHIRGPRDIWDEIAKAAEIPGTSRASALQPIETRRIMLQTGMRAPMGVKVYGPDLRTIEAVGLEIEQVLKNVPGVDPATVLADRIVGKPYLEIDVDREAIARHGLAIGDVQDVIEVGIGGKHVTTTVEGRERYPVRVRYLRELRDAIETIPGVLVSAPDGSQIPLGQLAEIRYVPGPQNIKSEDTFLVSYVTFDKVPGASEVGVVEQCQERLDELQATGELRIPPGVRYRFSGEYENQVRAEGRLRIVLPLALIVIFLILYLHFRSMALTALVFSGVFVAWAGGFLLLWLYGRDWFLDFEVLGTNVRELFQVHPIDLSVAVWVGFLALFGIATDDGVIMASYLRQRFAAGVPDHAAGIRDAVVDAGKRRIRPCLLTSATTLLALIPVLTSRGRGSDVMVPMAIPTFGGMVVVMVSVFVVPTLYCWIEERRLRHGAPAADA
ncbi:MAG: efflux RND transporter permease subunit [Planctomycetota bacterium]